MGKIIASVSCTLDGVYTGPQGDENNMVSWAMPGIIDSTNDNLVMFQKADAILLGRVITRALRAIGQSRRESSPKP